MAGVESGRPGRLLGVLTILASACAAPAIRDVQEERPAPSADPPVPHQGMWRLSGENDSFDLEDGNYTNGFGLTWFSNDVERLGAESLPARIVGLVSFLPYMADDRYRHHLGATFGQLIFTPENTNLPNPDPDDHPYSGLLFVDTAFYARGATDLLAYTLRLGVVGEPSQAEEVQKQLHDWFGSDRPRGWDHQLRDEPVLNLGGEYHYRLASGVTEGGMSVDLTPNVGGTVGNWMIAANIGGQLRFGHDMPDSWGSPSLRTGFENHGLFADHPGRDAWFYLFASYEAYAVGRYLPVDGNTWKDSRDTDRENFVWSAMFGLHAGKGDFLFSASYGFLSDTYEDQRDDLFLGAVSLSWFR